jgi:hypothetical protein
MISRAKLRLPGITESEFLDQVLQYAKLRGWRSAHFRPAKTIDGWRTPVSGDGKGFPDLLLVRGDRVIVAELKVGKNKLTLEQIAWLAAFKGANIPAFVWTPGEWPEIERTLE